MDGVPGVGVVEVFVFPEDAVLETGIVFADAQYADLVFCPLVVAPNLLDFLVERGDGLAILPDPLLERVVFRFDVLASLLGLVDAASEVIVLLPHRLVYLDIVPHIQDVQFFHYHLLLMLIPAHFFFDPLVFLLGLRHGLLQRPGGLVDALQPILQLLIFLF